MSPMADLVFEALEDADGGYCAECLTENIFTQADTWDELRTNISTQQQRSSSTIPARGE
jgi:predicted RNase H-like HicB family nuclease